mgnify:CR=1 FL=1
MRGPVLPAIEADASLALWASATAIAEKHATRSSRHKALLLNDTMVVGAAINSRMVTSPCVGQSRNVVLT